jgi:hypothetical protein
MKVWLGAIVIALSLAGTAHAALPSCTTGPQYGDIPDYECSTSGGVAGNRVTADCRQETYPFGSYPYRKTNGCEVTAGGKTVSVNRCEWEMTTAPPESGYWYVSQESCATGVGDGQYRCEGAGQSTGGTHSSGSSTRTCSTPAGPVRLTCTDTYRSSYGGGVGYVEEGSTCTVKATDKASISHGCMRTSGNSYSGTFSTHECETGARVGGRTVTCEHEPPVDDRDVPDRPLEAINGQPGPPRCG